MINYKLVMFRCEDLIVAHGEVVVGSERGGRGRVAVRVQVAVAVAVAVAVVGHQQVCACAEYRTATASTIWIKLATRANFECVWTY